MVKNETDFGRVGLFLLLFACNLCLWMLLYCLSLGITYGSEVSERGGCTFVFRGVSIQSKQTIGGPSFSLERA